MINKIYVHIGAAKTGTSAIQSFLNYNREKLAREYSLLYPNFNTQAIENGKQHNHNKIFDYYEESVSLNLIPNIILYADKLNIKNIILSSESIFDHPESAEIIHQAIKNQKKIQCTIIAYVRRQDYWLESAWKQWGVKNGDFENIIDYINKGQIRWLEKLTILADFFGEHNIIVHPYEKEQLPEGLMFDFLKILNIDYLADDWIEPPEDNQTQNFGFNQDIIEILKLNRGYYRDIHDNRLFHFFSEYLDDQYIKKPFEKYSILSPTQRLEILTKYEPMNQVIARKYLGRVDGTLFYEPWPDPNEPWEPYEGLTIEKIVPIFSQILYNIDKENKKRVQKRFKKKFRPNYSDLKHYLSNLKKRFPKY